MGVSSSKPMHKGVDPSGLPSGPAPTSSDGGKQTTEGAIVNLGSNQEPTTQSNEGAAEDARSGGCPMKRSDGSYSFSFSALGRGFQHPNVDAVGKAATASAQGSKAEPSGAGPRVEPAEEGKCPVRAKHRVPEYNVYSQPIDSSNQMPGTPNQLPAPQQAKPLSTERVVSNIPKVRVVFCETWQASPLAAQGNLVCVLLSSVLALTRFSCALVQGGAEGGKTWTYPSPQMFYNALARKGKLDGTREDDMDNVVAMHNNMNEKTWRKVLQWEALAGHDSVKLLKFQGRPTDLSPKALFKSKVFGHPLPFDRHDWVVLRDDNTTVRYVIDYYFDESRARDSPDSAMPPLQDDDATPSLLVDVRPALDGPMQLYERAVAMPLARRVFQSTQFQPLPILPSTNMKSQVKESVEVWQQIQAGAKMKGQRTAAEVEVNTFAVSESEARELAQKFANARSKCSLQEQALNGCDELKDEGGDNGCGRASLNWTLCVAPMLCALQHGAFQGAVRSGSDDQITSALATVTECVALQSAQHTAAKSKYPQFFHETSR